MSVFQCMCTGTFLPPFSEDAPVYLKRSRRCFSSSACVVSWSPSTSSASAAAKSICCSLGASAGGGRQRSSSMAFWSKMSGRPASTPSRSAGGSKRPSCTGWSMMSHSATAAHTSVVTQEAWRRRCLCWPGSAFTVSLRMTKRGSRKSMKRSRQPSNHTATKSARSSAVRAQRCQVFRCGKQITSETAATMSSARQVRNSPVSGGSAASPTLVGERPQAATAATKATAEMR
mmetsp:Transcript_34789/g.104010  ORF Transcript_34789/g.104010 Transcript_34789/m.104010 type:complete len:231 (+) Transcript_34789:443-1135(+)